MVDYISNINTKGQTLEIGGKNFDGQWVMKTYTMCSGVTLAKSAQNAYDISSYLPNDGYDYEVYLMITGKCPATAGQSASVYLYSGNSTSDYDYTAGAVGLVISRHAVQQEFAQSAFIPVKANRKKLVIYNGHSYDASSIAVYFKGYRRIGKNDTKSNYISNIGIGNKNIPIGGNNFDGGWVKKAQTICSGTAIGASGNLSYDISSYIPNDGNTYELMVTGWGSTGATSGNSARFKITTNTDYYIAGAKATNGASMAYGASCIALIDGTTRAVKIENTGSASTSCTCHLRGYRKLGKNNDTKQYLSNIGVKNETIEFGGKNFDGQWVLKHLNAYEWTSLVSGTSYAIDISSYLPNDGHAYEIMVYVWVNTSTTSGHGAEVYLGTDLTNNMMICRTLTRASSNVSTSGVGRIVISGKSRTINVLNGIGQASGSGRLWLYGYRRLGTNA